MSFTPGLIGAVASSGGVALPAEAWVALQSTIVSGSSTYGITFNSGWVDYKDLVLVSYGRGGSTGTIMKMNFNTDTASNYGYQWLYGSPAAANGADNDYTEFLWYGASSVGNNFSCSVTHIADVNSTTNHNQTLSCLADNLGAAGKTGYITNVWKSTAAITEIDLVDGSGGTIAAGSRFDLYGLSTVVA